ncbi:DUF2188 domain-containing protein [Shouchella sp. JSM 1781072]|mgnify:CR=1 FL=1|uniref:DUF2188 domain-containing protein n=1 Tax=Bacillaceae TaxID=186817 RepID=UPI000C07C6F1|nr:MULTISPECIES: DUF2188 domain-containing protein [Bacillaceae]UTR08098.1 DUF2188 domain-containing protein [Alkalihalobacillus sp. LMS6]
MSWNMSDYPATFKNFEPALRKKAIEIANAMIDDGYKESDAIPIATSQAKEWFNQASKAEIEKFYQDGHMKPSKNREKQSSPRLNDATQLVVKRDDGWAVKAEGAQQASNVYKTKKEAEKRAQEIADNKGSGVVTKP